MPQFLMKTLTNYGCVKHTRTKGILTVSRETDAGDHNERIIEIAVQSPRATNRKVLLRLYPNDANALALMLASVGCPPDGGVQSVLFEQQPQP